MKKLMVLLLASTLTACGSSQDENGTAIVEQVQKTAVIDIAAVENIIQIRCASCHSATPTDDVFKVAPSNVIFDDFAQAQRYAARIRARAVDTHTMPFMNKTQMTESERDIIGAWIKAGAPSE